MLNPRQLQVLVCPICKASMRYDRDADELICEPCALAYPVRDDVPVLIVSEARRLNGDSAG